MILAMSQAMIANRPIGVAGGNGPGPGPGVGGGGQRGCCCPPQSALWLKGSFAVMMTIGFMFEAVQAYLVASTLIAVRLDEFGVSWSRAMLVINLLTLGLGYTTL